MMKRIVALLLCAFLLCGAVALAETDSAPEVGDVVSFGSYPFEDEDAPQPIEWLETERGRTLCIYSLGNFVSGMANPVNMVGGLFEFRVISDESGRLVPVDPVLEPTVFYYGMDWFNTHIYMLYNYTPEIAATHGVAISGYTLTPDAARKYVTNVIEPEFLPDWMK